MGNNLFEKGFLVISVSVVALIAMIIATMTGNSEYNWVILSPFVVIAVLLVIAWDRLMKPEHMLHLEDDQLIIYPNLLSIMLSRGKRLELDKIQRVSLIEGYLAIYLQPRTLKSVELWFPDDITDAMQAHLRHSLPNIMVDRLINV